MRPIWIKSTPDAHWVPWARPIAADRCSILRPASSPTGGVT